MVRLGIDEQKNEFNRFQLFQVLGNHKQTCNFTQCFCQYTSFKNEKGAFKYEDLLILIDDIFKTYQKFSIVEKDQNEKEHLCLKYVSFMARFRNNPIRSYFKLKCYLSLNKTKSFYFESIERVVSSQIEKLIREKQDIYFQEQQSLNVKNSTMKNEISTKEVEHTYHIKEKFLPLFKSFLISKIYFWELMISKGSSINTFYNEVIKLSKQTNILQKNYKQYLTLHNNKINQENNIIVTKIKQIYDSVVINQQNSASKNQTKFLNLKKRDFNKPNTQINQFNISKRNVIIIIVSISNNKGKIIGPKDNSIGNFFGYSPREFHSITHINDLMPNFLSQMHDSFINDMIDRGVSPFVNINNETFGMDKQGFIFPINIFLDHMMGIQGDFYMFSTILKVTSMNEQLLFDENGKILGISRILFLTIFAYRNKDKITAHIKQLGKFQAEQAIGDEIINIKTILEKINIFALFPEVIFHIEKIKTQILSQKSFSFKENHQVADFSGFLRLFNNVFEISSLIFNKLNEQDNISSSISSEEIKQLIGTEFSKDNIEEYGTVKIKFNLLEKQLQCKRVKNEKKVKTIFTLEVTKFCEIGEGEDGKQISNYINNNNQNKTYSSNTIISSFNESENSESNCLMNETQNQKNNSDQIKSVQTLNQIDLDSFHYSNPKNKDFSRHQFIKCEHCGNSINAINGKKQVQDIQKIFRPNKKKTLIPLKKIDSFSPMRKQRVNSTSEQPSFDSVNNSMTNQSNKQQLILKPKIQLSNGSSQNLLSNNATQQSFNYNLNVNISPNSKENKIELNYPQQKMMMSYDMAQETLNNTENDKIQITNQDIAFESLKDKTQNQGSEQIENSNKDTCTGKSINSHGMFSEKFDAPFTFRRKEKKKSFAQSKWGRTKTQNTPLLLQEETIATATARALTTQFFIDSAHYQAENKQEAKNMSKKKDKEMEFDEMNMEKTNSIQSRKSNSQNDAIDLISSLMINNSHSFSFSISIFFGLYILFFISMILVLGLVVISGMSDINQKVKEGYNMSKGYPLIANQTLSSLSYLQMSKGIIKESVTNNLSSLNKDCSQIREQFIEQFTQDFKELEKIDMNNSTKYEIYLYEHEKQQVASKSTMIQLQFYTLQASLSLCSPSQTKEDQLYFLLKNQQNILFTSGEQIIDAVFSNIENSYKSILKIMTSLLVITATITLLQLVFSINFIKKLFSYKLQVLNLVGRITIQKAEDQILKLKNALQNVESTDETWIDLDFVSLFAKKRINISNSNRDSNNDASSKSRKIISLINDNQLFIWKQLLFAFGVVMSGGILIIILILTFQQIVSGFDNSFHSYQDSTQSISTLSYSLLLSEHIIFSRQISYTKDIINQNFPKSQESIINAKGYDLVLLGFTDVSKFILNLSTAIIDQSQISEKRIKQLQNMLKGDLCSMDISQILCDQNSKALNDILSQGLVSLLTYYQNVMNSLKGFLIVDIYDDILYQQSIDFVNSDDHKQLITHGFKLLIRYISDMTQILQQGIYEKFSSYLSLEMGILFAFCIPFIFAWSALVYKIQQFAKLDLQNLNFSLSLIPYDDLQDENIIILLKKLKEF